MSIKRDDFSKLKQGDRIEYLLKESKIDKENQSSATQGAVMFSLYMVLLLILITIFLDLTSGIQAVHLFFRTSCFIFEILLVYIAVAFIADLYDIRNYRRAKRELDNEFFNFKYEVTPKYK